MSNLLLNIPPPSVTVDQAGSQIVALTSILNFVSGATVVKNATNPQQADVTISGGSGTVTSVGLALPSSVFSISGSPVTSFGTLTGTFISQTANEVFASPNGSSGTPSFRTLVAADIPLISLTSGVSGVLPPANGGAPPVTKYLWVDNGRTDSYTADGSFARPFKTIGAAVTQIISNNDNSTHPYTVQVFPGTYAETVSLNSATLYNLNFVATGFTQSGVGSAVAIAGSPAISSTSNNTNLAQLIFTGFSLTGMNLSGDINNTNFGSTQILFNGCDVEIGSNAVTWFNVNNVTMYGGQFNGSNTVTVENVAFGYVANVEGFHAGITLTLIQNNGLNQPSQTFGNYLLLSNTKNYATTSIDAGSELDSLMAYWGSGSSVVNNGIIHSWDSQWNGTLTLNNGSTTRFQGDTLLNNPTINSGASVSSRGTFYGAQAVLGASAVAATNTIIVAKDGHYKSTQTTAPTTTINGNAGSGASSSVSNATDSAGHLSLTTGTASFSAGIQTTINFNKAYNVAPIVVLTPTGANAANSTVTRGWYVGSGTGNFTLNFATADTAQTTYTWNYQVIETQ